MPEDPTRAALELRVQALEGELLAINRTVQKLVAAADGFMAAGMDELLSFSGHLEQHLLGMGPPSNRQAAVAYHKFAAELAAIREDQS